MGLENITMGHPNLVQGDSYKFAFALNHDIPHDTIALLKYGMNELEFVISVNSSFINFVPN